MLTAITRDVNTALGSCELTFLPRVRIDTGLAQQQHAEYQRALSSLGCEIVVVPTEPGLPDSVFIEDTALVLDEIAVMCRPGAASRQPEIAGIESVLQRYRTLATIRPPGTLDGGDLLSLGKVIYAGVSTRSNQSGIEQLHSIVAAYGYSVKQVETTKCLHLKSAVSAVAPDLLLINPDWINKSVFGDHELIEVDTSEAHAANALLLAQQVIYPAAFPRTMDKLRSCGIAVTPVNISELQKAEGAVTCCSLIFTNHHDADDPEYVSD